MLSSSQGLRFSSDTMNMVTSSRSTSFGLPSGRAIPRRVTTIGPMRPAYVSATSSTWEWYIHMTELPSIGPGPERSGTRQT